VFDPAVYVGDGEVDLAMTELFGGFGPAFMRGYESVRPSAPGYALRRDLYNLYHLLNHLNLFGSAYLARTGRTLARLVER
jgi:fructosamine-3-kinase